jgi:hypothetical protein
VHQRHDSFTYIYALWTHLWSTLMLWSPSPPFTSMLPSHPPLLPLALAGGLPSAGLGRGRGGVGVSRVLHPPQPQWVHAAGLNRRVAGPTGQGGAGEPVDVLWGGQVGGVDGQKFGGGGLHCPGHGVQWREQWVRVQGKPFDPVARS